MSKDRHKEFVLRTIEERKLKIVRLWFTDILGYLKSVTVAPAEIEGAFEDGIGFDGSAINGFARVSESDSIALPDPSTFGIFPWTDKNGDQHSARMFCNILQPDLTPSWADSRNVLKKQMTKAAESGFSCYIHPEIEFFLFKSLPKDGSEPIPADEGGFFDQTVNDSAPDFRRKTIEALEYMGIPVEFSHHESAPGQQEIDLRYSDALSMADNVMTLRYIVKNVAALEGVRASFMPKPLSKYPGSAMHSHISLFEGDNNAFYDPDDKLMLSATAKSFMAGILEHSQEISAVTNQWFNSYRRLIQESEAPTAATWGASNRSSLVRVPMYSRDKPSSKRIEVRSPDSACNPYLTFAVILAAGMKGIEGKYELPAEAEDNVWKLSRRERKTMGYKELPRNLGEALHFMENSELVADVLGEQIFEYFLKNKWDEWNYYNNFVSPKELKRNLDL